MADWNPALYLQFKAERTQPARDLLARIEAENPARVLDVGCGPGNSTDLLASRWTKAEVIGIDSSAKMIEQARKDHPKQQWPQLRWVEKDACGELSELGMFDVVFSNAALQWMADHDRLVPRLFALLEKNGTLAVQVPWIDNSPLHAAVYATAESAKWKSMIRPVAFPIYTSPETYYRQLSLLTDAISLWQTSYYHVMPSHGAIIEWSRSTFMRPYLDQLNSPEVERDFENDVLKSIKTAYPSQANGRILFPFRRVFFIARK